MRNRLSFLRTRIRDLLFRGREIRKDTKDAVVIALLAFAAASFAVAFLVAVNLVFDFAYGAHSGKGLLHFSIASFVSITVSSLMVGWLLSRFCPDAAGSGIPQLKISFWKDFGVISWRTVWVKFVAGVVSIGGGASLGREGPTVFMGGGVASVLGGMAGIPQQGRRVIAVAGAAAALAAAFNTPLAAVIFALEEILHDLGSRLLGRVMLAAIIGTLVVHATLGPQPAFTVPAISEPRLMVYAFVPVTALLATLIAGVFQKSILLFRARIRRVRRVSAWILPCFGGWITWVLGCVVFALTGRIGVFGLGYGDLSDALTNGISPLFAGLLLAAKLPATIACYSFGGCGGIFSPTLFLGGMAGFLVAGISDSIIPLAQEEMVLLAAVGMSCCFGATVRAPWSSVLIVFEMTHKFSMIPALLLGTLLSQALIRFFGRTNFYDEILLQDGHVPNKISPPRTLSDWQQMPVSTIARQGPVFLTGLAPEFFRQTLITYPYHLFPVVMDGALQGVVSRDELIASLKEKRTPVVMDVPVARPDQSIREVSDLFISNPHGMVVISDGNSVPAAVLTLHDLLRAEVSVQE